MSNLQIICAQRSRQQLFNIPLARYTPANPYNGTVTQFQLDMRRKAEILKYGNTQSNTKTNNLTKAELYAQIVSGNAPTQYSSFKSRTITILDSNNNYSTYTVKFPDKLVIDPRASSTVGSVSTSILSNVQIVGQRGTFYVSTIANGLACTINISKPTPTSACGIPGPIINIKNDPTVPLYNLLNTSIDSAAYSESQTFYNTDMWLLHSNANTPLVNNTPASIGTINITNLIDSPNYAYVLQVPIGVYAYNATQGLSFTGTVNISSITCNIFFSGNTSPETGFTPNISLKTFVFNTDFIVTYNTLPYPVSINGVLYNYFALVDTINISEIQIATVSDSNYDCYLTVNSSFNLLSSSNFQLVANYSTNSLTSSFSLLPNTSIVPPTNLTASTNGTNSITVSFTPPSTSFLNPVLSYKSWDYGTTNYSISTTYTTNTLTINNLSLSSNIYTLNVIAIFANGSSASTYVVYGSTLNIISNGNSGNSGNSGNTI